MPYRYPVKVQIEDTDFGGVVYHPNYLKYYERARSQWLEDIGYSAERQRAEGMLFVVHHVTSKYLASARLSERLEVVSSVAKIKKYSIVFDQCVCLQVQPSQVLNRAEIQVACLDKSFTLKAIPAQMIQELSSGS